MGSEDGDMRTRPPGQGPVVDPPTGPDTRADVRAEESADDDSQPEEAGYGYGV